MSGARWNVLGGTRVIEVPAEMTEQTLKRNSIYSHAGLPGARRYRLNVVVKDVTGGTMNNFEMPLHVPRFEEDKLASAP